METKYVPPPTESDAEDVSHALGLIDAHKPSVSMAVQSASQSWGSRPSREQMYAVKEMLARCERVVAILKSTIAYMENG